MAKVKDETKIAVDYDKGSIFIRTGWILEDDLAGKEAISQVNGEHGVMYCSA